jgi:hypothetical protein
MSTSVSNMGDPTNQCLCWWCYWGPKYIVMLSFGLSAALWLVAEQYKVAFSFDDYEFTDFIDDLELD